MSFFFDMIFDLLDGKKRHKVDIKNVKKKRWM
jgi:hypothetical protein